MIEHLFKLPISDEPVTSFRPTWWRGELVSLPTFDGRAYYWAIGGAAHFAWTINNHASIEGHDV